MPLGTNQTFRGREPCSPCLPCAHGTSCGSCCTDCLLSRCNGLCYVLPSEIVNRLHKGWDCIILLENKNGMFVKVSQYKKGWVDERRLAIHVGSTLYLPEQFRLCRRRLTCPSRLTWGASWRRLRCKFILPKEFSSSCLWNALEEPRR